MRSEEERHIRVIMSIFNFGFVSTYFNTILKGIISIGNQGLKYIMHFLWIR
jgi:hypothetical protein